MSHEPSIDTIPPAAPARAAPPSVQPGKTCANCGAPMHGPFCYACGQPEKGMIRHLASVMSDVLDTVFNVDSRIFRSIFPLYFRPGFLTGEYFAGRRTRYVTPFRLFFFLCIISFFAIQASLNLSDIHFNLENESAIDNAQTEAELQQRTAAALGGIEAARSAPGMPERAARSLDKAAAKIHERSDKRLAFLKARAAAQAKGEKPPPDPSEDFGEISFDGVPWDPVTHPLAIAWLPTFANAKLNELAKRAKTNLIAAKRDPGRAVARMFSVLPQTLFLLMPLFAVLLKIVYIFKRRLYMEHLMVALHSHAFIFMSLLLLAILAMLKKWAMTSAPGVEWLISLLRDAVWIWLPIYLFLMQKRVYRQGWIMTTIKYSIIGICYTIIITFGIVGALLASLALA